MDFRILGPLEVIEDGRVIGLGAAKQQVLLAVLLLHPNEVVSVSRLIDELWGDAPPATATKVIQGYVSGLRKVLGAQTIITWAGGYSARIEPDCLDVGRFESLSAAGRRSMPSDPERAVELFGRALGLWRGPPLGGLELMSVARSETQRLVEAQLAAVEQRVEAELALGRHADLVQLLPKLVAQNPYRERLSAHLMLALYRCGRQVEALAAYRDARQLLVSELGMEPSRELQLLHEQMLAHDPALDLPIQLAPIADRVAIHEQRADPVRRLVTVVAIFVRMTRHGIDPESMHGIVERGSLIIRNVIERHGGSVQQYGGNTITAIFGLAELHEDDAVRAVRAAVELRDAEVDATVTISIGVESGSIFASPGTPPGSLPVGDAVELAAELAQVGSANEILLGRQVRQLAGPIISVDASESVSLPGRPEAVSAFRLQGLRNEEPALPGSGAYIGRQRELAVMRRLLAETAVESTCRLLTIVGPAGIGKSRLTREFLSNLDADVTVVVGRCLSYGEGITYQPLAEIVDQLGGGDVPAGLANILGGEPKSESIVRRILAATGRSQEPLQVDELFWAVRRVLESAARDRPLIVVVDDIHWAEPTLLDLIDHVATFSRGSPILLVCLARPDLLEARPSWAIPQPNQSLVVLDPLDDAQSHELVDALDPAANLGAADRTRAVAAAEGNPFFIEQIVAVSATGAEALLPLSVHAVLAARIDRLEYGERSLLSLAAVAGRSFRRDELAELFDDVDRRGIGTHLAHLVHKQFIRPGRPEIDGQDSFRFAHALIREAAYEAMPKQLRADLHEKMANYLKAKPSPPAELVGFHLERAHRFAAELVPVGDREQALGTEAAEWLDGAARAALLRGDPSAAAGLLERAVALFAPDDARKFAVLPRLGEALVEAGRLGEAEGRLDEAIRYARAANAPELAALARVERQHVLIQEGSAWSVDEATKVADTAIEVLAASGNELGQCRAWCLHAMVKWILGLPLDADLAWTRAAEHAERTGDTRELFEILLWRASAALYGPTPATTAIQQCREILDQVASSPISVVATLRPLALLHAMNGDFVQAHDIDRDADAILDDLGRSDDGKADQLPLHLTVSFEGAWVDLLDGEPAAAEAKLLPGYRKLEAMGEKSLLATAAAVLAQAAFEQGRNQDAEDYCQVSQRTAAPDDLHAQTTWRSVQARILAGRGRFDAAEALAREAVLIAARTGLTMTQADSLYDLGAVLSSAGLMVDAEAAVREAHELYIKKGNVVSAERARSWLTTRSTHPVRGGKST